MDYILGEQDISLGELIDIIKQYDDLPFPVDELQDIKNELIEFVLNVVTFDYSDSCFCEEDDDESNDDGIEDYYGMASHENL